MSLPGGLATNLLAVSGAVCRGSPVSNGIGAQKSTICHPGLQPDRRFARLSQMWSAVSLLQPRALPPSRPVQQWFGEFIHGVLEEAYRRWSEYGPSLPWGDEEVDKIEDEIVKRLAARGLRYRNLSLLKISKERGRLAINLLGPELFPLLARAESPLQAVRAMLDPLRSDLYEVKGIVDVLTSVELRFAPADNRLLRALEAVPSIRALLEEVAKTQTSHSRSSSTTKAWRAPLLATRSSTILNGNC